MVDAIIQARTGSTRLPNKIFADIAGYPLLHHVVERIRYCTTIERIIVATTTNENDNKIESWCQENNVLLFRGSEENVLERYYKAAVAFNCKHILRVTADDPFKDPFIIDAVVGMYFSNQLDFAYNNNPPSFPEGIDTEVFSCEALTKAYQQSKNNFEKEHVTQYFFRNPADFKQRNFLCNKQLSSLRWTIDTSEDLEMTRKIYDHLYKKGSLFSMADILEFVNTHPEISEMNKEVKRSTMYTQTK